MMKRLYVILPLVLALLLGCAACKKAGNLIAPDANGDNDVSILPVAGGNADDSISVLPAPADDSANGVQARPGSDSTGDPSGNLPELIDVSGTVKKVNEGLVLITLPDGSDYMLRFGDNVKWAEGVSQEMKVGNTVKCSVKPEPTFTTPSQGEVYEVTENSPAK